MITPEHSIKLLWEKILKARDNNEDIFLTRQETAVLGYILDNVSEAIELMKEAAKQLDASPRD